MTTEMSLLEGEEVRMRLKPSFLSFYNLYVLCLILIIIGGIMYSLFQNPAWEENVVSHFEDGALPGLGNLQNTAAEAAAATFVWAIFLLIIGFFGRHFWIDKGGNKLLTVNMLIVLLGVLGLIATWKLKDVQTVNDIYIYFLPGLTIFIGVLGFFVIDYYRRGFNYILTNLRLVISKRFITIEERTVRYSSIEDVSVQQGIIGRILNFGTVIPITASGVGTGSDESIAFAGGSTEIAGMNIGAGGGSSKSVRTSKAMPEESLFGIEDPMKVKEEISRFIHEQSQVTQLQRLKETLEQSSTE